MSGLRADITYIERQIENLSREIDESMQFLGLQENVSGTSMPRRVTRTSTPFTGRPDRALGNVNHRDVSGRQNSAQSTRIDANGQNQTRAKSRNFVKPATYDGSGMWNDYLSHFESVCLLNEWTETEKGLYLASSLRGLAQGVLGNQPRDERQNYAKLVKALQDRFAPLNQTELYRTQLRERRQRPSESLPEMGQEIRRLVNLAYPTAPDDVREILATEQFLDGLHNAEMRLKIKQARSNSLNDAIQRAVELEAFYRAESRRTESVRSVDQEDGSGHGSKVDKFIETMEKNMQYLQKEMKDMKQWKFQMQKKGRDTGHTKDETRNTYANSTRKCYRCGSDKHLKRDCPSNSSNQAHQPDHSVKKMSMTEHKPCDRAQGNEYKTGEEHSRTIHSIKESGVYVTAKINEMDVYLLIDTGATVSLLSKVCYGNIQGNSTWRLEKVDRDVLSANGSSVGIYGKTSISLALNGTSILQEMIVADISVDGILGLDFLVKHKAIINMRTHKVAISGIEHLIQLEGTAQEYKIALINRVVIPPRSEILAEGKICAGPDGGFPVKIGLIEPSEKLIKSDSAMLARSLVRRQERVPLRLMNMSATNRTIQSGTVVGKLSPVSEMEAVQCFIGAANCNKEIPKHLQELFYSSTKVLGNHDKGKARDLLIRYSDLFSETDEDVGRTSVVQHKIDTGNQPAIKQPPRRLPFHMQKEVDEHVSDMLKRGIIEPSSSAWSSAIVLVQKKDGSKRFCVDYRRLNSVTMKDAYPLPRIDESLNQLNGAKWFSTLDLNAGYWQVELDPNDKPKTAFVTRQGLFEFNVMPFGLCNAPATFERLMETVLSGLQWQVCLIYLDDVIVYGKTFEEMLHNLELVFEKLRTAGLKLKARKCTLFSKQVKYLGHVISEKGAETDAEKVEAVRKWPEPVNKTQVRSFIGLCSYYRKFIANFAEIARPLHRLTEASVAFRWTNECQVAFDALKTKLTSAPILTHPDFSKPFILDTDASQNAIGAALSQIQNGQERVVAYASKVLSKTERRYCVTRKELFAVVTFIKHFRHFLYGRKFLVRTDHSSLRWLLRFKDPEGQLARWLEVISPYDMEIEHRAGRLHGNADGLSRVPCTQCGYFDDWEKADVPEDYARTLKHEVKNTSTAESKTLLEMQDESRDIRLVKDWMEDGKRPDYSEVTAESYMVKSLWAQWSRLVLKDELLCRMWEVEESNNTTYQIVMPLSQRRFILQQMHDSKTSGHLGVTKTLNKIRQAYYWPGLQSDVRSYVAGCDLCARRKAPLKTKRAPMQPLQVGYPMERIATDILGEFPVTDKGNRYILVVSDYFTKWTEAFPMPNMEAQTVARLIVEEVICRFGVPVLIHSDQGRQYESLLFKEVCHHLQIRKTRTTPYHPQSDGMVERFNKTLATMLSNYVDDNHRDWDECIPFVMMAYRASQHESTGFTPNMLMLGRESTTPLDIVYDMPSSWKQVPKHDWVWVLLDRMERAHHLVRRHSEGAILRQKHYHDMKMSYEQFKSGDSVYVYFPQRKTGCSPKLTSYWRGPFQVLAKISEVLYKVNCGRNGKEQIVHCDRMKACKAQVLRGEDIEPESSDYAKVEVNVEEQDDDFGSSYKKVEVTDELVAGSRPRRERRAPTWLQDYVQD